MPISFEDFSITVPAPQQPFVVSLHEALSQKGAVLKIKEAKSGYLVSYLWDNKSIMNWVFRKSGILARIYGDHAGRYEDILFSLPTDMQEKMVSARDCKRLKDPNACSATCVMGMVYPLQGEIQKKCRNDGMLFPLTEGSAPHIQSLVLAELAARQGVAS